ATLDPVRMTREGCRAFRLLDGSSGAPISDAVIATDAEVFENPAARRLAPPFTTDAGGGFRFCPFHPGDRDFLVHHDGHAPLRVVMGAGEDRGEIDVVMTSGGSVEGEVQD